MFPSISGVTFLREPSCERLQRGSSFAGHCQDKNVRRVGAGQTPTSSNEVTTNHSFILGRC